MLQSVRGIVIVITIVFSCLSFTLGFFVGKFGNHTGTERGVAAAPEQALPAQNIQPQLPGPPAAEPMKAQPELSAAPVTPEEAAPRPAEPPSRPAARQETSPEPAHKPVKVERQPVAKQVNEVAKAPISENRPETGPGNKQENKEVGTRQKKDSPEPLYSVQLGAFRNKTEAERFRAKYSKKGYKIYIDAVKANRNVKVYKLRTGEFREKKDAEVLALKLKKNEDLKTFVVTVNK